MSFPPPTSKQANVIWFAVTGMAITVLVLLAAALLWGLGQVLHLLSPVVWPLAVAGVIAYLLDPVVDYLEALGLPRTRAILCVFSLAVVLLLGLLSSVVPQLVSETRDLGLRIPTYAKKLRERVENWANQPPALLRKFMGRSAAASGTNVSNIGVTNGTTLQDTN